MVMAEKKVVGTGPFFFAVAYLYTVGCTDAIYEVRVYSKTPRYGGFDRQILMRIARPHLFLANLVA